MSADPITSALMPSFSQQGGGFQRFGHIQEIGDNGHIGTFALHIRLAERDGEFRVFGHIAFGGV